MRIKEIQFLRETPFRRIFYKIILKSLTYNVLTQNIFVISPTNEQKNNCNVNYQVISDEAKYRIDEIESYSFDKNQRAMIYKNNGKSYFYHQNKIQIVKSFLQTYKAESIFSYQKELQEHYIRNKRNNFHACSHETTVLL